MNARYNEESRTPVAVESPSAQPNAPSVDAAAVAELADREFDFRFFERIADDVIDKVPQSEQKVAVKVGMEIAVRIHAALRQSAPPEPSGREGKV